MEEVAVEPETKAKQVESRERSEEKAGKKIPHRLMSS